MIWLLSTLAFADAIPMEPECPTGARGVSSHAGAWCDLVDAEACLCVVEDEVACGGRRPIDAEPCTISRKKVTGECGPDGACAEGTCAKAEACATATPEPEPEAEPKAEAPKDEDEGCSHVPLSGLAGLALLGLAALRTRSDRP